MLIFLQVKNVRRSEAKLTQDSARGKGRPSKAQTDDKGMTDEETITNRQLSGDRQ